jgi:hypothetical protein
LLKPLKNNFSNEIYIYKIYNFHLTRNTLKEGLKKILSFRIPSLIEIISFKNKESSPLPFAEMMMATPFETDELSMKICVYLFNAEAFP